MQGNCVRIFVSKLIHSCWLTIKARKKLILTLLICHLIITSLIYMMFDVVERPKPPPNIFSVVHRHISIYNKLGDYGKSNPELLKNILKEDQDTHSEDSEKFNMEFWNNTMHIRTIYDGFQLEPKLNMSMVQGINDQSFKISGQERFEKWKKRHKILLPVVTIICGPESHEGAKVMIKSAVIFGQDSYINLIILGDQYLIDLAPWLLQLRWTVNALGWDFIYDIRFNTFPQFPNKLWPEIVKSCENQLLFLASALPDYRWAIYIDSNSIVLSNLTQIWLQRWKMNDEQFILLSPNVIQPTKRITQLKQNISFHGESSLNTNVMIMQLNFMRYINFEHKVDSVHALYKDKFNLDSQDILNIIFHHYPEFVMIASCTFNFNFNFCDHWNGTWSDSECILNLLDESRCCLYRILNDGIHIVHGKRHFRDLDQPIGPMFSHLYEIMSNFNLELNLSKSLNQLSQDLKNDYDNVNQSCFNITGELLYKQTFEYFKNLTEKIN